MEKDIKIKIGVLITDENNNVLLIKEKIKKKDRPLWNIIKGTYGDNENENIFDAAIRECLEEASVKVKLTNVLNCYVSNENNKIRIQLNFLAEIIEGSPAVAENKEQLERNEDITEIKWFSKKDILKMRSDEFISGRTYALLSDWIKDIRFPLNICKQTEM